MNENLKTVYEWAEFYDSRLINLDGFDKKKNWNTLKINKEDFLKGASASTMELSKTLVKDLNDRMRII